VTPAGLSHRVDRVIRWRHHEGKVPDLAPIHLQLLCRQALEPHRHVGDRPLLCLTQALPPYRFAEDSVPTVVGLLRVGAG